MPVSPGPADFPELAQHVATQVATGFTVPSDFV
jgi:hypothetical protein